MKTRITLLLFLLSFFCSITSIYATEQLSLPQAAEAKTISANATAEINVQKSDTGEIIVYYFYTTARCPSCHKIETYTKEAIHSAFADELKNKSMVWKMINTDEAANEHFLEDYKLFTKSVILADAKTGTWKNLDKVWELLGSEESFKKYIVEETKAFLTQNNKGK